MKKLLTLFLAIAASVGMMNASIKIGDFYYNLDAANLTAELSYKLEWVDNHYSGLTTATIPATVTYKEQEYSVTSIGEWAFRRCISLTSVTIPNSVTSIGDYAFYDCIGLTSVTIPNSVTNIGNHAFDDCEDLTSVTIGNSVTSIGDWAFSWCTGLTSVTIPNSVTSIGGYAFAYCSGLTSVTIPNSLTSIGTEAFRGCTSLTSVTIPNSVTSIGERAFYDCISLTSVTIPNSVTSIGEGAFYDCISLTSIEIPNSVTSIGERAFMICTGLTSVTIPNSVTSIGRYAFQECSGLTSVTIGNSVTSIVSYAFRDCTSLTSVTNYAITPQTIDIYVFYSVNKSSCTLYVPAESLSAYQAADVWSDFGNIEAIPTMNISANQDPKNAGDYYSTFYHSTQRYTLPGNGTEAYVADLSGGDLILTRIAQGSQVLPNNVAVILKAPISTVTLTETNAAGVSFSAENDLRGVDAVTPLEDLGLTRSTCYVLSGNSNDGVGFFQCNSDNLKAHKAYLSYAGAPSGAPRRMRFVFDNTTDVESVQSTPVQSTKILRDGQLVIIRNGVEYNAAGQMIQ